MPDYGEPCEVLGKHRAVLLVIMFADLTTAGQEVGRTEGGRSAGETELAVIEEVTSPPVMATLRVELKGHRWEERRGVDIS